VRGAGPVAFAGAGVGGSVLTVADGLLSTAGSTLGGAVAVGATGSASTGSATGGADAVGRV
jgi:hypothetical protein